MNVAVTIWNAMEIKPFWFDFMPSRLSLFAASSEMEWMVYQKLREEFF